MKKYAAVWLIVLMLVSNVSADRYITLVIRRGTYTGFPPPLVFDHEPSGFEVFIVSTFPSAYPVIMRVYDSVQGVMQKVLLLSEEAAKSND